MLKRYCDCVLLAMDSDNAGQEATLKAVKILLPLEFEVKVIRWPGGKDPDELYKNEGAEFIAKQVEGAVDFFDFLWERLEKEFDQSQPFGRQNAAIAAIEYLRLIPTPVARELYIQKLAQRVKVSEAIIARQMSQNPTAPSQIRQAAIKSVTTILDEELDDGLPTEVAHAEETLLELALADNDIAQRLGTFFSSDMISNDMIGQSLNTVVSLAITGGWEQRFDILSDMENEREQEDSRLGRILVRESTIPSEKIEKAIIDTVTVIRRFNREKRLTTIKQQMQNQIDQDERRALLQEYLELSQGNI